MREPEEDEHGDEVGEADDGGGFGAVFVDGPAGEGAEDEIGDVEGDEEKAGAEGGEGEERFGFGGNCGVECREEGCLDEGEEEGDGEAGVAEAVEDRELLYYSGLRRGDAEVGQGGFVGFGPLEEGNALGVVVSVVLAVSCIAIGLLAFGFVGVRSCTISVGGVGRGVVACCGFLLDDKDPEDEVDAE